MRRAHRLLGAQKGERSEEASGAPADEKDDLVCWLEGVGLDRLSAQSNDALWRQVARGVWAFHDPRVQAPQDLVVALKWRSRKDELVRLLAAVGGGSLQD